MMEYAQLGRAGLRVSRLALGTRNVGPYTDESTPHAIMDDALEDGINFFDTAKGEGAMRETPFKRVIMRTNEDGKSVAVDTGPIPVRELDPVRDRLEETTWGADILTVAHDATRVFVPHAPESWQVEPPPAGAVFRAVNFAPHSTIDLHTTGTIDVGIVISGEIWLTSEDGEVQLKPHDCVVVPGSVHGWVNRSDEPCLMAACLMSTQPPECS